MDNYLDIKSINSFIKIELKENQDRIDEKVYSDINNLNYRNKPIFEVFRNFNFIQKEYCISIINFGSETRYDYSETIISLESRYFEARGEAEDVLSSIGN